MGGREGRGEEGGRGRGFKGEKGEHRFEAEDSNEGKRSSRNGEFQLYFTLYTFIRERAQSKMNEQESRKKNKEWSSLVSSTLEGSRLDRAREHNNSIS